MRTGILPCTYEFDEMLRTKPHVTDDFVWTHLTVRHDVNMLAHLMFVRPIRGNGMHVIWVKVHYYMVLVLDKVESIAQCAELIIAVASTEVESFDHLTCT
jgi:hypothetical protein